MNPRKKDSKKWSKLPTEFTNQIKTVFEENFNTPLQGKKFVIEGRIYPSEVILRAGINYPGELRFHNFEVSLDHSKVEQDAIEKIHIAVDALASLLVDYFADEDEDKPNEWPLTWHEYPFEKQKIWIQYSSENPDLEAEANRLLGLSEDGLIIENSTDDFDMESEIIYPEDIENIDPEDIENIDPKDNEVSALEDIENLNPELIKNLKKKKEDMH